jgi:hypothetical protein
MKNTAKTINRLITQACSVVILMLMIAGCDSMTDFNHSANEQEKIQLAPDGTQNSVTGGYEIITLGTLSNHSSAWAVDINEDNQIAGTSWGKGSNPEPDNYRVFKWINGNLTDLGEGQAHGINVSGSIAGLTGSGLFVDQNGSRTDLNSGYSFYRADQIINNSGTVTGLYSGWGAVWNSGEYENEPVLLGLHARCAEDETVECTRPETWAINSSGDVVGHFGVTYTDTNVSYRIAAIWSANQYDDPTWLEKSGQGGADRAARGVNDAGWIVGVVRNTQAAVWIPDANGDYGFAIDLPTLGAGWSFAYAVSEPDVNGVVRIVGESDERAVLWTVDQTGNANGPVDLGTPHRHKKASAFSMNEAGYIVGQAVRPNGNSTAVLWQPVSDNGDDDDGDGPAPPSGDLTASFDYSCSNSATCEFTDTSTGDDIESRTWDPAGIADDGRHTFDAGEYAVTLTITDSGGNSSSASKMINCRSHPRHGIRCS